MKKILIATYSLTLTINYGNKYCFIISKILSTIYDITEI
jgi:hypothetical protein